MKVTDNEILNAVWNEQIKEMCGSFVTHYTLGRYGLADMEHCKEYHTKLLSINRKYLNLNISNSSLLSRIRKLIDSGDLTLRDYNYKGTFYYESNKSSELEKVILVIRGYWSSQGMKSDESIIPLDDFEGALKILEDNIVLAYGK